MSLLEQEAKHILEGVEKECGWMYETKHTDGRIGRMNYTVWSDVFVCPECSGEVVFWEAAVDNKVRKSKEQVLLSALHAVLTKRSMNRAWTTKYDEAIKKTIKQAKQVPVLINYSVGKERYEKKPDQFDLDLINKIDNSAIPYWFPTNRMMKGKETRRNDRIGITHVHHFYTKRNLWILSALRERCSNRQMILLFNSQLINISKLNRYRPGVSFPYNLLVEHYILDLKYLKLIYSQHTEINFQGLLKRHSRILKRIAGGLLDR